MNDSPRTTIFDSVATTTQETCARYELFGPDAPFVLMVSGGADSVALLNLFVSGIWGDHPATVFHLNHGYRGADADNDETYVEALCERLDVPCVASRINLAELSKSRGENLEAVGREERYKRAEAVLDALCKKVGAPLESGRILTAHTRSDRIETFFMRTMVGGGLGAFASIPRKRDRVVRPLLDVDGELLRDMLRELAGATHRDAELWREDDTNSDIAQLRAYVRHNVMPVLHKRAPHMDAPLTATMDRIEREDAFLAGLARRAATGVVTEQEPGEIVAWDAAALARLDPVIACRVVRQGLLDTFPQTRRIEAFHIEQIARGGISAGFVSDIPGNLRAINEYGTLKVLPLESAVFSHLQTHDVRVPLPIPGSASVGTIVVEATSEDTRPAGLGDGLIEVVIDGDALQERELTLTHPRQGDRMRPLGMAGTKKLSDVFIDEKIPKTKRGDIVVVRDGHLIVWIVGLRLDARYQVKDTTKRFVRLTASERE